METKAEMMAAQALKEIRDHEEECRERYRQIVSNQNVGAQDRMVLREQLHAQQIEMLQQLNAAQSKISATLDATVDAIEQKVGADNQLLHKRISEFKSTFLKLAIGVIGFESIVIAGMVGWKLTHP